MEKQFVGDCVGKSVKKIDSKSLSRGKPLFTDDLEFSGMLIGKVLRSPYAHARIKDIDISKAEQLPGVHAVICHTNVPRILHTTAGQGFPEPSPYDTAVFNPKVRFIGDRVAAVAAESEDIAERAIELIKVDYEILIPLFDPEKAMDEGAPIIHDQEDAHYPIPVFYNPKRNHAAHVDFEAGDVEVGLKQADFVIERKFKTHYSQHTPIEPHIAIAYFDENDRLIIRTSTQVPFHVRRIVSQVTEWPVKKIRVIKPRIGGGFGTKQEIIPAGVVAILAIRSKRPVKIFFTRKEEFVSSRTRHPMVVWIRAGVKKDGTITALDLKVLSNTGAYGSHALTVMSNAGSKTLPLYKSENVKFWGDTVYTNLPVGGAYRGYGATQAAFGLECVITEMAESIGMDPAEFRRMNHIKVGETSPVFKAIGEGSEGVEQIIDSCALTECIDIGCKEIDWVKRNKTKEEGTPWKTGLGMATLMQGSSIPEIDMGAAFAKMNDDGSFNLHVGATDLGTGSDTVLAQIFAEIIRIPIEDIIVYSSDTDMTPFDVGAYASSTTYLSGYAVKKAGEAIKEQIMQTASEMLETTVSDLNYGFKEIVTKSTGKKVTFEEVALYSLYSRNQYQIGAMRSHISHKSPPPFSAHFAEILVNEETGELKLLKYVAAVDCGTAINPKLALGQTDGAVLNGISYALTEEYIFNEKGRMLNPSLGHYKIWTTNDLPELKSILVPSYEPTGPYGAKSVSEISINGPMPAIANAIYNAVGVRMRESPFTPERILKAIKANRASKS